MVLCPNLWTKNENFWPFLKFDRERCFFDRILKFFVTEKIVWFLLNKFMAFWRVFDKFWREKQVQNPGILFRWDGLFWETRLKNPLQTLRIFFRWDELFWENYFWKTFKNPMYFFTRDEFFFRSALKIPLFLAIFSPSLFYRFFWLEVLMRIIRWRMTVFNTF